MYRSLVVAAIAILSGANAQNAAIVGDTDNVALNIAGASFTLKSQSPQTPKDADWNETAIGNGNVTGAIAESIADATSQFATLSDWVDLKKTLVTKEQLDMQLQIQTASQEFAISDVFLEGGCDSSTKPYVCSAGEPEIPIKIVFIAKGLALDDDYLYNCVLTLDAYGEKEPNITVIPAIMTLYPDVYGAQNQQGVCILPPISHESGPAFSANLAIFEGQTTIPTTIPGDYGTPFITFENRDPYINNVTTDTFVVVGTWDSIIENKKLPVQLNYGDAHTADDQLQVTFKTLTNNAISSKDTSFVLDVSSKILTLDFKQQWLGQLRARTDASEVVQFNMTVTDNEANTVTHTFSITLTTATDFWNPEGSSSRLSKEARSQILGRAGLKSDQALAMCFSFARDGRDVNSATNYHLNCDGKGPLILLHKRVGNNQIAGAFSPIGSETNGVCRYRSYGNTRNVSPNPQAASLFRVLDKAPDAVEFAYQKRTYNVEYTCGAYLMYMGQGDFRCTYSSCYSSMYGYYGAFRTAANDQSNEWIAGAYTWRGEEVEFYEVYYAIKQ